MEETTKSITVSLKHLIYLAYKLNRQVFPLKPVSEFVAEFGDKVFDMEKQYQNEMFGEVKK